MSSVEEALVELQAFADKMKEDARKEVPPKKEIPLVESKWDTLPEEEYTLFMAEVGDEWECEQYKEKYLRSYSQVMNDVWKKWELNRKEIK